MAVIRQNLLKIDNYDILYDVVRNFHPKIKEIILNKTISGTKLFHILLREYLSACEYVGR